jgi:hypothetical protein
MGLKSASLMGDEELGTQWGDTPYDDYKLDPTLKKTQMMDRNYDYQLTPTPMMSAGKGLEEASQNTPNATAGTYTLGQLAAKGATQAMNAGGTMGQTATSAGLMMGLGSIGAGAGTAAAAAGPVGWGVAAGGLALSAYEQSQKAEAMNEQARVQEAQQRKADVQTALNQALGATRQLGV